MNERSESRKLIGKIADMLVTAALIACILISLALLLGLGDGVEDSGAEEPFVSEETLSDG